MQSQPRASRLLSLFIHVLAVTQHASAAITLDLSSQDSIKAAAKTAAQGMMQYYTGDRPGDTPGNLPQPYYWWEAGAMFGAMIDYWYFTGDDTWNNVTTQAMLHQTGPDNDYMPPNQTKTEGNDDQGFWGMAAMSAAEDRFPNPPEGEAQWLALAQAVFETQRRRWDNATCDGGLRWQIFTFNNGYNYKNTISNGCFFNLASRLAVYTGNSSYAHWAETSWNWTDSIGLIDSNYNFFDGSDVLLKCSQFDHTQWTYNAGVHLAGAANMYNFTGGSDFWRERVEGIIRNLVHFMPNGDNVISEVECEPRGICNIDQRSFKAYLARWIAMAAVKAPFAYSSLKPILEASATAAVRTCTGGDDGNQCGLQWTQATFDGSTGVGEMMSALEVIQGNLIDYVEGPVTADTGGTSEGDPNAGQGSRVGPGDLNRSTVTKADRVGAGLLTVGLVLFVVGGAWWLIA